MFIKHIEDLNMGEDFIFSNIIPSFSMNDVPLKEIISLNWLLEVVAKPKGTRDGVLQC